jgi:hypothetical protein
MFMVRSTIVGLLVAASTTLLTFTAHAAEYASASGWTVFKQEDGCSVMFTYQRDTTLFVSYTLGNNTSFLAVLDPAFKSVKEDEKYPVEILFIKGRTLDDGWGKQTMRGLSLDGMPGIGVNLVGRTLLSDLKSSDNIVLTRNEGDIIVESLTLKGSAAAVAKLEQCSAQVQKQNPVDPFAN